MIFLQLLCLFVQLFLFIFVPSVSTQQSCQPPDVPAQGGYTPKLSKFQPGDKVTYNCTRDFTLMGKDASKCKSNGDWSNPTPFCDMKARMKSLYALDNKGYQRTNLQITDSNTSTCYTFGTGESILMTLKSPGSVYALRIFLKRGTSYINITTDTEICDYYRKPLDTDQWVLIKCKKNDAIVNTIKIQDQSSRISNSSICEIEVYVKEEEGCENPPDRRVANGYFQVTRSMATLICEKGYKTDSDSARLVCEKNVWVGSRLQCSEILCNPVLNIPATLGSDWIFMDPVKKISAGTKRKLKCSDGYSSVGSPDIIVCLKEGVWTDTNATCVEVAKTQSYTRTIIFGAVGGALVLIIISLFATTIYFVRRQRREVVVVYKQPTEGSVISGSEAEYASAYYESIHSVPQPPTSARPTAQMLSEGYFTPLDTHGSLKKQPTPADIAFGYSVPYEPISKS